MTTRRKDKPRQIKTWVYRWALEDGEGRFYPTRGKSNGLGTRIRATITLPPKRKAGK